MDRHPADTEARDVDVTLGRAWREHRRHVLDIAFGMLGNLSDAEDAVQEAFARLVRADLDQIDDIGGWLVTVVSRLCLDKLRSHRRHPTAPDPTIGVLDADGDLDPADRVTLDDNVRIALHVVLERLSPAERTAFVLHDVFQYPFDAIAEIVGRTPAACRQLASRARRTIVTDVGGPGRFAVETAEQRLVTERFIAAAANGDLDGLLAILDPDVAGGADVGGSAGVVTVTGAPAVAAAALRFLGPSSATTLLSLPAAPASEIVAVRDGHAVSLITLTVHDGRIHHIDGIVDPVKLAPIADALGIRVTLFDPSSHWRSGLPPAAFPTSPGRARTS
jgi:RNA polymerase sigma-70 factor, ECF subfamily